MSGCHHKSSPDCIEWVNANQGANGGNITDDHFLDKVIRLVFVAVVKAEVDASESYHPEVRHEGASEYALEAFCLQGGPYDVDHPCFLALDTVDQLEPGVL